MSATLNAILDDRFGARTTRTTPPRIRPGSTLELKCQGCPVWFEWVVPLPPEKWAASIPAFHGRSCRKRHSERRNSALEFRPCRRAEKRLYRTEAEATRVAMSLSGQYQELFTIYRCRCGGLHVGRVPFRRVGSEAI